MHDRKYKKRVKEITANFSSTVPEQKGQDLSCPFLVRSKTETYSAGKVGLG